MFDFISLSGKFIKQLVLSPVKYDYRLPEKGEIMNCRDELKLNMTLSK